MTVCTEAVYLHDATLRTLATEILSCQPISSLSEDEQSLGRTLAPEDSAIVMRQTILYPRGGGQPSDTGTIALVDQEPTFTVSLVRKADDGKILHFGKPSNQDISFAEGQRVIQNVDAERRDYHSRLHTGGHILGVAMEMLMPGLKEVKANHAPGEACLEFEGLLYNEHKASIQEKLDDLVKQDLPILISWAGDGSGLKSLGKDREGAIRIVSIGGLDQTPCGGTHVSRTSQVGHVEVRKVSRQKGISRVSYEVPSIM
ncbi:hypothetical protein N7532_003902 [Penicillium argentinense]|uniref:Alanyl-transfer RNA synthetases family profile domain-containing protein n=1 Tax=Penicillium argentinense TaxID=1131581 RepID=A0A9W9FND0_9EURO|nr:uncharacterized protein N7532_003902 [Penicillium argentinense]KAJ5103373.1 hypothetical protein N7532_003902 [Penicillium argentinense]